MSAKLLLANFDGTMPRLEVFPAHGETRVELHTRYWDNEDKLVDGRLVFTGVAALNFSLNCLDNPVGSELFGLYELTDPAEKTRLLRENFDTRRRGYLTTGYDGQGDDPADMLNQMEPVSPEEHHLYLQLTQGGIYRILAKDWALEE